jgi:hypothetical protein
MFNIDNISSIKGYDTITVNQEMFKGFLKNFIQSQGAEARETVIPISVSFCKDSEGKYLKFVYKIHNKKEWMHVTSPRDWF